MPIIQGINILSPNPTGEGGLLINENFRTLSKRSVTTLSTRNPTTTDDYDSNYSVGSRWFNQTSLTEWVCISANSGELASWVKTFPNRDCYRLVGRGSSQDVHGVTTADTTYYFNLVIPYDCYDVKLIFSNSGGDGGGPAGLKISAGIQKSSGSSTFLALTFNKQHYYTFDGAGGRWDIESDPMTISLLAGSYTVAVYVDNSGTSGGNQLYFLGYSSGFGLGFKTGEYVQGTNIMGDVGEVGTYHFPVAAVIGKFSSGAAKVGVVGTGDSIMYGSDGSSLFSHHWLSTPLSSVCGVSIQSRWGKNTQAVIDSEILYGRIWDAADVIVSEVGNNDLTAAMSFSDFIAIRRLEWAMYKRHGCNVVATTITPRTTSTDSWATVENQSYASAAFSPGGTVNQFNDWLLENAVTEGVIFFDLRAYVADTTFPYKWKPNYTGAGDSGVHPKDIAIDAISVGVTNDLLPILNRLI